MTNYYVKFYTKRNEHSHNPTKKISSQQKIDIKQLKKKAAFWDEFVKFMEDKIFGSLMELAEKEKNISLLKAKKMLR